MSSSPGPFNESSPSCIRGPTRGEAAGEAAGDEAENTLSP